MSWHDSCEDDNCLILFHIMEVLRGRIKSMDPHINSSHHIIRLFTWKVRCH